MVCMNEEMKKIIINNSNQKYDEKMHKFLNEFVSKTRIIKDCIIYDDHTEEEEVNWNSILKLFGDCTGYKIANNELIYKKNEYPHHSYLSVAKDLNNLLENKYKDKKFVIYIILDDDYIQIRFHTYRTTEISWLTEDLNKYAKPILCLK